MIEEEERDGNGVMRQSDFSQRAGKTESVQETKAKGNEPWPTRGERGYSAPCNNNLDSDQHNAERDGSLHRRAWHVDEAERRCCESDAVRNGEGRHGKGDLSPRPNQNHQGQYEQKMVVSEQDMLDSKAQICGGDLPSAWRTLNDE
jgi:hypothetical protein